MIRAETIHRYRSFGFHAVESLDSRPFRWTGPVAGLWLEASPGRQPVALETASPRPPGLVGVFWDGRPVVVERGEREIRFELTTDGGRSARPLVLIAEPVARRLLPPGESRALGVPVFAFRIGPSEGTLGASFSASASSASSTRPP